jgi:hypothetical protein
MHALEPKGVSVSPLSTKQILWIWVLWIFLAEEAAKDPHAKVGTVAGAIFALGLAAVLVFVVVPLYWLFDLLTFWQSVRYAFLSYLGVGTLYIWFSR